MSVLVGKQAPDFTVPAVLGDGQIVDSFNFSEATRGKYAVLVFYQLDFTFVCPSELIALDHRIDEFISKLKNNGCIRSMTIFSTAGTVAKNTGLETMIASAVSTAS